MQYEGNSWAEIMIFSSNTKQKGVLQGCDLEEWVEAVKAGKEAGEDYLKSLYGLQEVITQTNKTVTFEGVRLTTTRRRTPLHDL